MMQSQPTRVWFLERDYKKHPRLNLWGKKGCAYFLNARGQKLKHNYGPAMRAKQKGRGYVMPSFSKNYHPRLCHIIMAEIFYGEREVFKDSKGKPYFGQCHHLINEPLNYAPENLLCWLTRSEHRKADNRRRALEAIVPDHNLHILTYDRLRRLQDPRTLSDEDFQTELDRLRDLFEKRLRRTDPLELAAKDIDKYC